MYILQRVLNSLKNINTSIKAYTISLILSRSRKNCAAMSHSIGISEKQLYNFLAEATKNTKEITKELIELIKRTRDKKVLRALVIDPTAIIKHYAQKIEKLCHDRTGCTKKIEKVLVPVYAAIIDNKVTIPFTLDFWVQKKIIGKKKYKTKIEIAQELIMLAQKMGIDFDLVTLDGAFSSAPMFQFYKKNKDLKFSQRIAKSRIIQTSNGVSAALKDHPELKLHRNEREKTVKAKFNSKTNKNDEYYFFTAQKRRTRNHDWEVVYIISNIDQASKEHVNSYNLRLPIEPMIRTTKQKFGATQCQVIESSKQHAHIMAGFFAYSVLSVADIDKQLKSIDALVNNLRDFHFDELINEIVKHKKTHTHRNIDLVTKVIKKHHRSIQKNVDQATYCAV